MSGLLTWSGIEMSEVNIWVRTNKQGSDVCAGGTGYSREEWESLTESEQNEIISELIWNAIDVYEKD